MERFKYMFKHKHNMTTKTITITEDAYNKIKHLKHENESFSKLFTRLTKEKHGNIDRFFGILKAKPAEIEKRRKHIVDIRNELSRDFEERIKKLRKG